MFNKLSAENLDSNNIFDNYLNSDKRSNCMLTIRIVKLLELLIYNIGCF